MEEDPNEIKEIQRSFYAKYQINLRLDWLLSFLDYSKKLSTSTVVGDDDRDEPFKKKLNISEQSSSSSSSSLLDSIYHQFLLSDLQYSVANSSSLSSSCSNLSSTRLIANNNQNQNKSGILQNDLLVQLVDYLNISHSLLNQIDMMENYEMSTTNSVNHNTQRRQIITEIDDCNEYNNANDDNEENQENKRDINSNSNISYSNTKTTDSIHTDHINLNSNSIKKSSITDSSASANNNGNNSNNNVYKFWFSNGSESFTAINLEPLTFISSSFLSSPPLSSVSSTTSNSSFSMIKDLLPGTKLWILKGSQINQSVVLLKNSFIKLLGGGWINEEATNLVYFDYYKMCKDRLKRIDLQNNNNNNNNNNGDRNSKPQPLSSSVCNKKSTEKENLLNMQSESQHRILTKSNPTSISSLALPSKDRTPSKTSTLHGNIQISPHSVIEVIDDDDEDTNGAIDNICSEYRSNTIDDNEDLEYLDFLDENELIFSSP